MHPTIFCEYRRMMTMPKWRLMILTWIDLWFSWSLSRRCSHSLYVNLATSVTNMRAAGMRPDTYLETALIANAVIYNVTWRSPETLVGWCSISGLVFNSIVDCSKLLKGHVSTSKFCLLLLLNLLQVYYRSASAMIYDRAECRSSFLVLTSFF